MYRFRTIENLLGKHNELENQEIYFASPEELNDPMEGYKDVFWKGDRIVWKNFIINYIKSVDHFFGLIMIGNPNQKIPDTEFLVEPNRKIYGSVSHQNLIQEIINRIFRIKFIDDLPKHFSERTNPIRRAELISNLETIHHSVVYTIAEVYFEKQMISRLVFAEMHNKFLQKLSEIGHLTCPVNKLEEENPSQKNVAGSIFSIINFMSQQMRLITAYDYSEKELSSNWFFLTFEFPEKYISKLESSVYPDWYSASFLSDCSNSSIWSHYGSNHKGVCLKFKVNLTNDEVKIALKLNAVYAISGSTNSVLELRDFQPNEFYKINYDDKPVEIDFFRSLARMNRTQLNAFWYSDGNGNQSICCDHLDNGETENKWRKKHWDDFIKSISVKQPEWSNEQEYRLIIQSGFYDYTDKNKRKLKYDFNDLESVIFGIKTDIADKIRIMKIIENKCLENKRKNFDFYQAYFSMDNRKILLSKLDLIKFS